MIGGASIGGLNGWRVLQRTSAAQIEAVARLPTVQRASGQFSENITKFETAADLVGDYQSLTVALTAFGLEDDIPNKAYIRQVLESDLDDPKSLANRLSDNRYRNLAKAMGFGEANGAARRLLAEQQIPSLYVERTYELKVGELNGNLRFALYGQRRLPELFESDATNLTKLYEILGSPPLKEIMTTALGLPNSFGLLPIERQADELLSAIESQFGVNNLTSLAVPSMISKLTDRFIIRADLAEMGNKKFSPALALLTGASQGSSFYWANLSQKGL